MNVFDLFKDSLELLFENNPVGGIAMFIGAFIGALLGVYIMKKIWK